MKPAEKLLKKYAGRFDREFGIRGPKVLLLLLDFAEDFLNQLVIMKKEEVENEIHAIADKSSSLR